MPTLWYSRQKKALGEVGDKIDAADKAAVEADVQALKDLLAKANTEELTDAQVAEIKAGKEKLMESAQKLFTKVYEQAGAQAGQAGPQAGQAGPQAGLHQKQDRLRKDLTEMT